MEGLLIFVAIIALNFVAAKYKSSKEKKEAERQSSRPRQTPPQGQPRPMPSQRSHSNPPPPPKWSPPGQTEGRRVPSGPAAPTQPIPDPLREFLKTIGVEPEQTEVRDNGKKVVIQSKANQLGGEEGDGGDEGGRKALQQAKLNRRVQESNAPVPKRALENEAKRKQNPRNQVAEASVRASDGTGRTKQGTTAKVDDAWNKETVDSVLASQAASVEASASANAQATESHGAPKLNPANVREGMLWSMVLDKPRWREPYRRMSPSRG